MLRNSWDEMLYSFPQEFLGWNVGQICLVIPGTYLFSSILLFVFLWSFYGYVSFLQSRRCGRNDTQGPNHAITLILPVIVFIWCPDRRTSFVTGSARRMLPFATPLVIVTILQSHRGVQSDLLALWAISSLNWVTFRKTFLAIHSQVSIRRKGEIYGR